MSKIQTELVAATGVKPAAGQARQAFLLALIVGVHKLGDAEWDALSKPAQEWFNDAADAKTAKKDELPEMPDYVAAAEPKPSTRRRAAEPEPEPEQAAGPDRDPEVGDVINATTKRGKQYPNAVVVEIGEDFVAVQPAGTTADADQIEIATAGATFEIIAGEPDGEADPDMPFAPAVGDVVTVTNKRGKATTGKIVEIDEEVIVLDTDAGEVEFDQARVESVAPAAGAAKAAEPAKEEPPAATGRRRAAAEPAKEEPAKDEPKATAAEEKAKRSSNPRGVSVGARIRELVAESVDITEAEVGKALKKEGLEFRDTTLSMIFKDCAQFVALLRAAKKLK